MPKGDWAYEQVLKEEAQFQKFMGRDLDKVDMRGIAAKILRAERARTLRRVRQAVKAIKASAFHRTDLSLEEALDDLLARVKERA